MIRLSDYINNDFKPLEVLEKTSVLQDFFNTTSFSHFPIVNQGIFIGNISSEDAETFDETKKINDYLYTLEGFFTRIDASWLEILEKFAKNQCNIIPILNVENKYVGYYEINDIIRFFNETPFLKEAGSLLIVEKNASEYSFGQISQIIEGNNGILLGLFISNSNAKKVQITIKIATGIINEIIQTFRRYEYDIISEHLEDNYINNLKERSEYLARYLSI